MFTSILAALLAVTGTGASAQPPERPPCAACIVLSMAPGQSVIVGEPLNGAEVLIRIGNDDGASARAALEAVRQAGGRAGVLVTGLAGAIPPEVLALAHRVVIDLAAEDPEPEQLAFRLKSKLVELRGGAADLQIGVIAGTALFEQLLARDIQAYVDFHAAREVPGGPRFPRSVPAAGPPIAVFEAGARAARGAAPARWIVPLPADAVAALSLLTDVARSRPFLPEGLIAGGMADVRCGGASLPTYLDPESLATVAVAVDCRQAAVASPGAPEPRRLMLSTGESLISVPAAEGRFAEGVRVTGARTLTVREIIARHQAAAARQRRAIQRLISTGTMTLTFEAPGFPAPMAITSRAIIYTAPDAVEIEQQDVRVNGIGFAGGRVPRLPLLEPERVASPPLAIALSDVYTYALAGEDEAAGVRCYVIRFEPVDRRRSLFAGRVWIGMETFAMVKVSAVQTALRGSIVSSEQTDEFARDPDGHWLLARSEVRQLYEGAGHRTPIHRVLAIDSQEVNPDGFDERRQASYRSAAIMLRDTAAGFRYLKREPAVAAGSAEPAAEPALAGPSERVRTLALGVIIDPNISRPLPFAGLSYVDFNLFGTGTQFNGFFGGSYGQLAISVPSLGGTRWQLAGRAFGIASSYNDRAFVNGRENYEWNISQRPAHASVWLLRPVSARITTRAGYELDYTGFGRTSSTSPSFAVPASQVSHAVRLGLEGQWGGWSASIWWAGARRAGWRRWGEAGTGPVGAGDYQPRHRDYQRAGATVSRSVVFSPRLVGRVEVSGMTGRDLDRFSRYTFGSFDNRLRGYPSALIRYDRGGVVRGVAAWAAGRLLRIDGFVDSAFVRDPGFGTSAKSYSGVGAAAEVPAPFGTLVAVEWGYGFQGIDASGRTGTQVIRISGYKIF